MVLNKQDPFLAMKRKGLLGPLDLKFVSHIGIVGLIHGDGEVRISTGLSVHRGKLAGDGGNAGQLGGVHADGGTHTVSLQRVRGGERLPTEILSRRTQSGALVATDTRRAESKRTLVIKMSTCYSLLKGDRYKVRLTSMVLSKKIL